MNFFPTKLIVCVCVCVSNIVETVKNYLDRARVVYTSLKQIFHPPSKYMTRSEVKARTPRVQLDEKMMAKSICEACLKPTREAIKTECLEYFPTVLATMIGEYTLSDNTSYNGPLVVNGRIVWCDVLNANKWMQAPADGFAHIGHYCDTCKEALCVLVYQCWPSA